MIDISWYMYAKALHIVFVITWFSGLFYIGRLFVYQTEAQGRSEPARAILTAQLKRMSWRLWYIIAWPSAILAMVFGMSIIGPWWREGWMQVKLLLVAGLIVYHMVCHRRFLALQGDRYLKTSIYLRIFNEGATIFLFGIVFLAVWKRTMSVLWAGISLGVLVLLLGMVTYMYRRFTRDAGNKKED